MNDSFLVRLLKSFIKSLVNFFHCFEKPEVIKVDNVTYIAQMKTFDTNKMLFHYFFKELKKPISVLGPYHHKLKCRKFLTKIFGWPHDKADFFLTGEHAEPRFDLAKKQIGFWLSLKNNKDVYRWPAWMDHLDWSDVSSKLLEIEGKGYEATWYYGMRISINKLMKPILSSYSYDDIKNRKNRSVLISSHFKKPRDRFFKITDAIIGCDGFGKAFNKQDYGLPKMNILEKYNFNLCPENLISEGYITEKIPHAFHAGCIPISWCDPDTLKEDFNPEAVINLFGLDDKQCKEVLNELIENEKVFKKYLSVPLLLKKPQIEPLINFLKD